MTRISYVLFAAGRVQKNQKTVEKETSMAYQRAIGFAAGSTFHNPFYICVMQPSYIDYATFGLVITTPHYSTWFFFFFFDRHITVHG